MEDVLDKDEMSIKRDTGADDEVVHRIGEFDDLRDRLERIEWMVEGIADSISEMRTADDAIDIDNGATVADIDEDGDADIIDDDIVVIPDYDDLDLDL